MPVKVRCPDCSKGLNAPDKARGKALKCPNCGGRVKVPSGKKRPAGGRPKKRRPRPAGDGDVLAGLDLRNAEDQQSKICPKCAKYVGEEHEECPYCGVNVDTGVLSEKQKRRRSGKGPDPDDFFKKVWPNSAKFVKKNKHLAIKTAVTWAITLTLSICSARAAVWCFEREVLSVVNNDENEKVTIDSNYWSPNGIVVDGDPNSKATFLGTKYSKRMVFPGPRVLAAKSPVVWFWSALAAVFAMGFAGWGIFLTTTIVQATMQGEKKLDRMQSDFFGNITLGIRAYVWPWIVLLPLSLVPYVVLAGMAIVSGGVLSQGQQIFAGATAGIVYLGALFLLPPAVVHWSQKHTFPAWLFLRMLKNFFKTIGPCLTITGMILLTCALLPIGVAVGAAVGFVPLSRQFGNLMTKVGAQIGIGAGDGFADFAFAELPVLGLIVFLTFLIVFLITAWPTVYMMRALGLYGLYFRNDLELVPETTEFQPAGFGPRFLAWLVDSLILFIAGLACSVVGNLLSAIHPAYQAVGGLLSLIFTIMYYTTSEAGQARATPGKWSLGLVVLRQDNKPMDKGQAFKRTICSFVTQLTLYIGFLFCLFDPQKLALQDKLSGTKVCFKGDDERS